MAMEWRGWTQYAAQLDSEGWEYLQRIKTFATRFSDLIQSILDYSRVSRAHLDLGWVELETLVLQVIDEYLNVDRSKSDIQVQRLLESVMANEPMLTQCVANLVSNALKFVCRDQRPVVRIWTEPNGALVKLFVQDNGVGVAPENRRRIFDLFTHTHLDKDYVGTGIGLAIVQRAVTRMGGTVGVDSEPDKGSTFWIELPKAEPSALARASNGGR